ncbi:MAG: fibronectin type III domain-containing protein, partial [Bacteroidetes bacterium]|nr:fibronectin type III domain-containing protein [Bacteroidota bacterium]
VRGTNVVGTGPWSGVWTFTTSGTTPVPDAPVALDATGITDSSFTARWIQQPITSTYRLDVATDSSFSSFVSGYNDETVFDTSDAVTGLSGGTTYYVRVRASNSGGTSGNSNTVTALTIPDAPVAEEATNVVDSSFTAVWMSSVGASEYRLDVALDSLFSSLVGGYDDVTALDTTMDVTGLSPLTAYYYRVRAVNTTGTSENSDTISVTMELERPDSPIAAPATDVTDTSFVAHWGSLAEATSYRLDIATDTLFTSFVPGYDDKTVNGTSDTVRGVSPGMTYYYRVRGVNPGGTSPNSNRISVTTTIGIAIAVYLQGPFSGAAMGTALNGSGFIPLSQPYNGSPWSYAGGEAVGSVPAGVVDWVLVELRSDTGSSSAVATRAGFLKSDGALVDTNGTSVLTFHGVPAGGYYIVIRHRNHLAVMSALAVAFDGSIPAYDFTTGPDKFYGGDAKEVSTGVYGMYAGDVNPDGTLKYNLAGNDRALILTAIGRTNVNATVTGYYIEDVNLDGIVKYNLAGNDRAIILTNIGGTNVNATKSTLVPSSTAEPTIVQNKRMNVSP